MTHTTTTSYGVVGTPRAPTNTNAPGKNKREALPNAAPATVCTLCHPTHVLPAHTHTHIHRIIRECFRKDVVGGGFTVSAAGHTKSGGTIFRERARGMYL